MAQNPLRNTNRQSQLKINDGDLKQSVSLYDIDYAIMTYLQDVVLPPIEENGTAVKIPVVYGNSERWNSSRREGIFRDQKGKIQLPILMLRRTTVAKNDAMPMLNRHVSYQTVTKWSKDNRYSRFGILSGNQPKYELFNITMPDYVEINYECMGWTAYTEQLNTLIESLNWASDEYWGDKKKFKFHTTITDYNVVNEIGEDTQRINRIEFTLNVKAYLLPEKFDGENTTKKGINIGRVVFSNELDLTANGRLEQILTNPNYYNSNKDLVDYLDLSNSYSTSAVSNGQTLFSINNIRPVKVPILLVGSVITSLTLDGIPYEISIYKNSTKLTENVEFTSTYLNNTLDLTFINSVSFDTTDSLTIFGKFITL